jgi:hypothetical protein
MDSIFQKYRKILDELEVGLSISRQGLFYDLGITDNKSNQHTADKYRKLFENAMYIEYMGLGLYKKSKPLDEFATSASKLKRENDIFLECLAISDKWKNKTADDMNRERKWRTLWRETGLSAEKFVEKYTGSANGELYGI